MKKLFLLFATMIFAGSLFFVSCEVEEACETDNVGSVTVTNNTGEYWVFDVTGPEGYTNEEVTIYDGDSYTWEDVDAGSISIWASDFSTPWEIATTRNLSACQDLSVNFLDNCELFNYADVSVINNTGEWLWVNVEDEEGYGYDQYLSPSETGSYTVEAGDVRFISRYSSLDNWTYSDYYSISECEDFQFTWNAKKMSDLPNGLVVEKVEVEKPTKKGSKIDFSKLPQK